MRYPSIATPLLALVAAGALLALSIAGPRVFAETLLPPPDEDTAVGLIAAMAIYQEHCLRGGPLPGKAMAILTMYVDASGMDTRSERVGTRIRIEILRQTLQVQNSGHGFCETRIPGDGG